MRFIHESPEWPQLVWRSEDLLGLLAGVRHRQGLLLGRMQSLGFDLGQEATLVMLTSEVVTSSAIEGEMLDAAEVRSSLAGRLGLDVAGLPRPSREVEGVVEMMLDATQNVGSDLTAERLFAWHSGLFPNGRSGMSHIAVGEWRPPDNQSDNNPRRRKSFSRGQATSMSRVSTRSPSISITPETALGRREPSRLK